MFLCQVYNIHIFRRELRDLTLHLNFKSWENLIDLLGPGSGISILGPLAYKSPPILYLI